MRLDINCDMGEGIGKDEELMPFITSANIACGFHAGDAETMWQTAKLAIQHGVRIGAHPSFPDRENFGRREMDLTSNEIYELVIQQLILLNDITTELGTGLVHVKPHGALYNRSARDPAIASAIALAVKEFDKDLILFGLSGSHSITAARDIGLQVANEVFADRNYEDDGSLVPRGNPGALIEDVKEVGSHVMRMANDGELRTLGGKILPVAADTVCIHGDGTHAIEFAKAVHKLFNE
jgi:5-oxoprolinase (ATP-hydrolysing) subunit A